MTVTECSLTSHVWAHFLIGSNTMPWQWRSQPTPTVSVFLLQVLSQKVEVMVQPSHNLERRSRLHKAFVKLSKTVFWFNFFKNSLCRFLLSWCPFQLQNTLPCWLWWHCWVCRKRGILLKGHLLSISMVGYSMFVDMIILLYVLLCNPIVNS